MVQRQGFTLVELMVVIAIIGILSAVLIPSVTNLTDKANAAKAVAVVDTLRTACDAYYTDVGVYPYEYATPYFTGAANHRLAFNPGVAGWNGPYLKAPLSSSDNPWKVQVYLYANTNGWQTATGGAGFDLDGDGTPETTLAGDSVVFYSVSTTVGPMINTIVDGNREGAGWAGVGKFEYITPNYGTFYVTGGR